MSSKKPQPLPSPEAIAAFLSDHPGDLFSAAELHDHWGRCNVHAFYHYLARLAESGVISSVVERRRYLYRRAPAGFGLDEMYARPLPVATSRRVIREGRQCAT